jgi:CRP/FNR family cyclic AMP-dependent transcriptional regulator
MVVHGLAVAPVARHRHAARVPTTSDLLAKVPLFSMLDANELAALGQRIDEVHEAVGTVLFHAGDPGDALYVVLDGEVEVFVKNATGERLLFERAKAGDFFGEISLLDAGPRTASAEVTRALHALVVDREDLKEFLTICPAATMDLLGAMGKRLRETARILRGSASRNVNVETEDKRTSLEKGADWISEFSGSLPFLFIHIGVFAIWIVLNVPPLAATRAGGWDTYPFGLLTMSVSLEAIILSVFVLLSQNRQILRDRVRNDIEYDVNLKAELEVAQLHEKVDQLYEQVSRRLANLERGGPPQATPPK